VTFKFAFVGTRGCRGGKPPDEPFQSRKGGGSEAIFDPSTGKGLCMPALGRTLLNA